VWANEPGITAMTFDDEGRMFASTIFGGQILILDDADYNGTAEIRTVFAGGLDTPLGLVFAGEKLFVTARHQIFALQDTNHDDQADSVESVVEGLPVGNPGTTQSIHQTNGIVLGPDGLLYVSQGAVGNAEELTQPWEGAVFTVDPTTYQQSLFAEGFRNPYALVFDAHGHLLVTDNGADHLDEYELEDA
ncbi:MAG: hypothetical protein GY803_22415, partial [Chloroflexi bacterium]|nr:hypothetical protein [Chloroflexota bacterium]